MLVTRYPVTFATSSPIQVKPSRHSAGVTGFTHRYMYQDIAAAVGATATLWSDYAGALDVSGTNGPTVRALADGRKYLEFDGVNDTLGAIGGGTNQTVVMVAKTRATATASTLLFSGSTATIARYMATNTILGGGGDIATAISLDNQWRVVIASVDGTTGTITVDGVTATAAKTATFGNVIRFGANSTPANFAPLDIVESITYAGVLDATQKTAVRNAMKAAYPTLLV